MNRDQMEHYIRVWYAGWLDRVRNNEPPTREDYSMTKWLTDNVLYKIDKPWTEGTTDELLDIWDARYGDKQQEKVKLMFRGCL